MSVEMLEGMAPHEALMLSKESPVLLYLPVAEPKNFLHALAYWVRRLDENMDSNHYLAHSFDLKIKGIDFEFLSATFLESLSIKETLPNPTKRTQNRASNPSLFFEPQEKFHNEPGANFYLKDNFLWAEEIVQSWRKEKTISFDVMVGSESCKALSYKEYYDAFRPHRREPIAVCGIASWEHAKMMLSLSQKESSWKNMTLFGRTQILNQVASEISKERGRLIGLMASITAKTFLESDAEISEAIDFAKYYPYSLKLLQESQNIEFEPLGLILVVSPWDFPLAIPLGGVFSALSSGNHVILKPSFEAYPLHFMLLNVCIELESPERFFKCFVLKKKKRFNRFVQTKESMLLFLQVVPKPLNR